MDPGSIVYVLALLVAAVIVVVLLLRLMKARVRTDAKAIPPPATPAATPDEEEYLDSSHILSPGTDAAARAAEALRQAKGKRK